MKVALIHDYIKEYGGAERVLEALHEIWPEAPIFTTVYLPKFLGPHMERFRDWDIRTSGLQKIPWVDKLISPIRIFTPWVFENWDLSKFDVMVVSATGAYFPNLIAGKPKAVHICYCHTPPRYLYGYSTARDWQKHKIVKIIGTFVNHWLRQTDYICAQRPDYFVANSNEVKKRIKKFYRREAVVIYPPVDLASGLSASSVQSKKKQKLGARRYYLTGGRLARAKRIDLAIHACNKLKLPLKVFGKSFADYGDKLRNIAGSTVEFLGEVSDEKLVELYKGARAFIYPSEQEDFGIIPVEAMTCGLAVIGLDQGGVRETVVDGKTGVLFSKPIVEDLVAAINRFNKIYDRSKFRKACMRQAEKFGKERFKKEMKEFIEKKHEENNRSSKSN